MSKSIWGGTAITAWVIETVQVGIWVHIAHACNYIITYLLRSSSIKGAIGLSTNSPIPTTKFVVIFSLIASTVINYV